MAISASKLRKNARRILDQVLETGVPVEIIRRGKLIKIIAERPPSKLSRLKKRRYPLSDPESIVHMDWLSGKYRFPNTGS